MSDVPVFIYRKDRSPKLKSAFVSSNKEDILATIAFLYKRGMWSKFHHDKWSAEVKDSNCEEYLHLYWDSITSGAMFEMESPHMEALEAKTEAMEEKAEEKVKMKGKKHATSNN